MNGKRKKDLFYFLKTHFYQLMQLEHLDSKNPLLTVDFNRTKCKTSEKSLCSNPESNILNINLTSNVLFFWMKLCFY